MANSQAHKDLVSRVFGWIHSKSEDDARKLLKIKPENFFTPHLIPNKVVQNPLVDDEPKKLIINFDYFRSDKCIFETADPSKMRSLLEKLCQVCGFTAVQFYTCSLVPTKVNRDGRYLKLYTNLDPATDLYEIEISGRGRFYGFIDEKYFFIVAVDAEHRNTN